jgi:TonB family protein
MFRDLSSLRILLLLFVATAAPAQEHEITKAEALQHLQTREAPLYPPLARQARIQGPVQLSVSVDPSGNVTDVRVVEGHPMLTGAAVEAVREWKFEPFLENDSPTEVTVPVTVEFKLVSSPDELESDFKRDYSWQMQRARELLAENRTDVLGDAAARAKSSLQLAQDAHHSQEAAAAQLLLARIHDADHEDATAEYLSALTMLNNAANNDGAPDGTLQWAETLFYAGRNDFRAKRFTQAEPRLRQALRIWQNQPIDATPEIHAQIARSASMLATCDSHLNPPRSSAQDCRIFKREKRSLHGLELDETAQACK